MPQGKVLGGGSILNAMCWNRGGSDDFDAWEGFGNPGWGWSGILPYFMKASHSYGSLSWKLNNASERDVYSCIFRRDCRRVLDSLQPYCSWNLRSGAGQLPQIFLSPIRYVCNQSLTVIFLDLIDLVNLFAGMNLLGLPTQFDPNDGTSAGPAFVPSDLDPNNQTRSDARRTYFDPYITRSNLHVITGHHVTRVLIEGVGGNAEEDDPTLGGNDNGNGPASGNNEGFGFGPGGSTPPLSGQTPPRFSRRQDPNTSNLRIYGVEVGDGSSS